MVGTTVLLAYFETVKDNACLFVILLSLQHKICTIAYISIYYSNSIVAFPHIFGQKAGGTRTSERKIVRKGLSPLD
jgi:hypothetical protein